jgi:hypothetical protein
MKKIWIAVTTLGSVALLAAYLYPERPLYASRSATVEATIDGVPVAAHAYSALFVHQRTYIHIPRASNFIYRWYGINWDQNLVGTTRPYERIPGILTVNKSGPIGIGLLNPKIEDRWNVQSEKDRMTFSNATIAVRVLRT